MTKMQTRQYAMLVRVRDFGQARSEQFPPGSEAQKAFALVISVVAQVDAFNNAKLTAKRISQSRKLKAKRDLKMRISAIARSARALATAEPGADEKFPMPTRQGDIAVLMSGRLFLQEGAAVKERLVACGLPPTFLDDLRQAVTVFEQQISGRSAARTMSVVAHKGIRASIRSGVVAVGTLDAYVANVLGHDEAGLNAWKRDRRVDLEGRNTPVAAAIAPVMASEEQLAKAS